MSSFRNHFLSKTRIFRTLGHTCTISPSLIKQHVQVEGNPAKHSKDALCSHLLDALVFQPEISRDSRKLVISPAHFHLPFEVVFFETRDKVKLFGYLIKQWRKPGEMAPTVVFLHGNSGNIGDRLRFIKRMHSDLGCNFFLPEYRGYGLSNGSPSEEGAYLDAQAALDHVLGRKDVDQQQLIVFGRSLGGAIAIDLATRKDYKEKISALIIENTFSSLSDLAHKMVPSCFGPLIKLLRVHRKFSNYRKIAKITRPTLFISGLKDSLILPDHMTLLYLQCKAKKRILRFHSGDHLNVWKVPGYRSAISLFIEGALNM